MSLARNQEQVTALGWAKQADIATANLLAGVRSFTRTNGAMLNPKLNLESNAAEYGKGHEFETAVYKTSWDCDVSVEATLSSELATWAFCYGLGTVVESPAGTYTVTPLVPTTALELPYFSYLQAIRQGASPVWDDMAVGCAVNDFLIKVAYGPSRANYTITINIVGSGRLTEPSAITQPALVTPHWLPSASLAFTLTSMDYVALKRIVSLEFGWNNNINKDFGFYPGCGEQGGVAGAGAVRGRLLIGTRIPILRYTVLVEYGSTEWTKLKAGTTGTAVITMTASAAETFTATYQQVKIVSVDRSEVEGFAAVNCECTPEYHSSNGVLSVVSKTAVVGCAQ